MKPFFFPSTKFLLEANIFTSFCLVLRLLTLFPHSFINLDLHLSVSFFFSFIYDSVYHDHIYQKDYQCLMLFIVI